MAVQSTACSSDIKHSALFVALQPMVVSRNYEEFFERNVAELLLPGFMRVH
eukprot:m.544639 g.544639  ORF g.544639 m.544639 type:complete len:51 (+) comp22139_c0_seq3:2309-2461(+)